MLLRKTDAELNVKEDHAIGVDSTFFDMSGLNLLAGDIRTALTEPNTLILTKTAAEKHFEVNEALGQHLLLDNEDVFTVTGVIDDMPKNSFLRNHSVFIAMASYDDAQSVSWANWSYPTFLKLRSGANIESLKAPLNTIFETYMIPWVQTFDPTMTVESHRERRKASGNYMVWSTTALTDIHLFSTDREDEFGPNSDIQNVYILSFLSLLSAIAIADISMTYFNQLSGKAISMPYDNPVFWLLLVSATVLLGLFSGSSPAFFMSNFTPVKVLKGSGENSISGRKIRNSLVVFQFAISVFLIVSTLVVFQQLKFIQNKDLGFQKDQVLIVDDVDVARNQLKSFKHEVLQLGQVERASLSRYLPTPSARNGVTFFVEGAMERGLIFGRWKIDHDYVSALDMEFLKIIGVVKNFHFESLRNDTKAAVVNPVKSLRSE